MEKHTKDEINFRGFLAAYRTMQGVQMKDLTKGLYSISMMSRVESGERLPKKLERDRLVARLGVSNEDYEDYLSREEHAEWKFRQEILKSISEKNVAKLEEQLRIYSEAEELDKVEKQFLETMRFMLLKMKGASEEELCTTIELAVSYTIEDVKEGFPENLILADQEINLLIEYVSLHHYGDTEKARRDWRFARYSDIIAYIEKSYIDCIGKAKVYPKLVYYICKEYMNENSSQQEVERCLRLCTGAIELLRDTRKLYYFVELLETHEWFTKRYVKIKNSEVKMMPSEYRELAVEAREWADLFIDLYKEFGVSPYMDDFVYLYLETESHCINEVVRIRRKMLKITQAETARDACDIKTVRRTEQGKMSPQMFAVRGMFGNLGLCPEYVRGNVITHDPEVMKLHLDVMRYDNEKKYDEWRKSLDALEKRLCMDIVQNRQAVMRERVMLDYETKRISKEEAIEKFLEALELTISIDKCMKLKEWYFTMEEVTILHNIAGLHREKNKNKYEALLIKYFEQVINQSGMVSRPDIYEIVVTGFANHLGDKGEYDSSDKIADEVIANCMKMRRMRSIVRNLYIKCWNRYNVDDGNALRTEEPEVHFMMNRCIKLSRIIRHKKLEEFFVAMLKK